MGLEELRLRDYQQRAIDDAIAWLTNNTGHPCLELPTGAGKSVVVAELCRKMAQDWGSNVTMVTSSKELVAQNAERMRSVWPNAPIGVYSAGLKKRELGNPITFAGIQSIYRRAAEMPPQQMLIVDECHLINHENEGMFRQFINELTERSPDLRVVGLTATPFRLGHGLITDEPAIFKELLQPTSIEELIYKGYLSPLRSKLTGLKYDVSGVHKRGGDFIEGELAQAVDTDHQNDEVVRETVAIAGDRKAWLFFATGVMHAVHLRDSLIAHGVDAACITGDTPAAQRDDIIRRFKAGEIRALTNANVLTTGFDYPAIDLLCLCRPTMSPVIYMQQAGRGLRICEGKEDCLVLDFAGVVEQHGPITAVQTPKKNKGSGNGEAPSKVCDECYEIVAASAKECPTCGARFPEPEKAPLQLRDDDIMQVETHEMDVASWHWVKWNSKKSGKDMLRVDYFGKCLDDPSISEYLCVRHDGYAKRKAERALKEIEEHSNAAVSVDDDIDAAVSILNLAQPPKSMAYKKNGKFWDILKKNWGATPIEPVDYDALLEEDDIPF